MHHYHQPWWLQAANLCHEPKVSMQCKQAALLLPPLLGVLPSSAAAANASLHTMCCGSLDSPSSKIVKQLFFCACIGPVCLGCQLQAG